MKHIAVRCVVWMGVVMACISFTSCAGKKPDRKETIPVSGEVYVDGQPAAMLQIECHPVDGLDKEMPTITQAVTDQQGKFQLATYEAGDGVPIGEYRLTFVWQDFSVLSASYTGPDKLTGRYSDVETSQVTLKCEKGKPIDMGRIDLTTQ